MEKGTKKTETHFEQPDVKDYPAGKRNRADQKGGRGAPLYRIAILAVEQKLFPSQK